MNHNPPAIVVETKLPLWWYELIFQNEIGSFAGFAGGNIVFLSPLADEDTLNHELVHIKQSMDQPFLFVPWAIVHNRNISYYCKDNEIQAYYETETKSRRWWIKKLREDCGIQDIDIYMIELYKNKPWLFTNWF